MKQFEALGLSPNILRSLSALGYETPTPIQKQAIPLVLEGHDLMGLAQTGTGKTAAFGLPLCQRLLADKARPGPRAVRALILAPTRELVGQIADSLRGFVRGTPLSIRCVVGGASINIQMRDLQRGADILVATPGRLLDLVDRGAVHLNSARYLVLDEADQMLDLGFIHALRQIAKLVGTPRQTMLFSATMPKQIETLSKAYLTDPVRVEVSPPGRAADKVRQSVHFVPQERKAELLKALLAQRETDLSLVFARTKHGAEKLMKQLVQSGLEAASIHGNKSQPQRERAIKAFRNGDIRVLVATDVAARGIDIPGVSHVYNYDLPEVAESYVHRIGRTARAGANGEAVAFCSAAEKSSLRSIEKLMGIAIPIAGGAAAELPAEPARRNDRQKQRPANGPAGTAADRNGERRGQGRPARNDRGGSVQERHESGQRRAATAGRPQKGEGNRPQGASVKYGEFAAPAGKPRQERPQRPAGNTRRQPDALGQQRQGHAGANGDAGNGARRRRRRRHKAVA